MKKIVTLSFLILSFSLIAQSQVISTIAGTPYSSGYTGDGGPATKATLNADAYVCLDDSGNVFIGDSHNNVVRKVSAKTGIITTVAGNGTLGYSGDGGAATAAELNTPFGIYVDDSENIYFADYGNDLIRKVTASTGIINTVAGSHPGAHTWGGDGGPATDAYLSYPTGVTLDDSGNIYIADQWNWVIREVSVKTGIINTVAGDHSINYTLSGNGGAATSAGLDLPCAVAVDDSGNIYIADQQNNEIRKVTKATGIINDFAGTGYGAGFFGHGGGYTGDNGPATAAELYTPGDMHLDDSGNVFIADANNNVIRKVSAKTGIITTVAGDSALGGGYNGDGIPATTAQLNNPNGVTVDKCGNLYIADYNNNLVREVTGAGGAVQVAAASLSLCSGGSDTLTASGADVFYWSPSAGLSDTTGSVVIASPTVTTTYIITGSTFCAAAATPDTIVVTVNQAPAITITPLNPQLCAGQSVTLKASGYTTYQWVGTTDTTDSITVSASKDTSYELMASNGTCTKDTFIEVRAGGILKVTIQPQSQTICAGQTLNLKVSGGYTYNWSPSTGLNTTTGDSVIANPSATVTYTVTAMDTLGCSGTGVDTVTVVPVPNTPTISQHGDTLVSSASTDNQWYLNGTAISGATGSYLIIGNSTETYTVAVENPADGCTSVSAPDVTSGINLLSINSSRVSIYPNPTNSSVNITINSSVSGIGDWNLRLTDVLGQTIYARNSLDYNNVIDMSTLAGGLYFITVTDKTDERVFKVVKQ